MCPSSCLLYTSQEYTEPEDVTYMRLLAGEDEYRACVLYLGGSYEITTDVQKVLDSQQGLRELWGFVYDIPQDHWVVAPDGGCDLYCIFPQEAQATLFVYETSLTDDAEKPLQCGKQLYYSCLLYTSLDHIFGVHDNETSMFGHRMSKAEERELKGQMGMIGAMGAVASAAMKGGQLSEQEKACFVENINLANDAQTGGMAVYSRRADEAFAKVQ